MIKIADKWKDYRVIATGNGDKLEKWGSIVLLRPDPQAIWTSSFDMSKSDKIHAIYHRDSSGGGRWDIKKPFKDEWLISYCIAGAIQMKLVVKPMGFKHTGIFPEQAVNWDILYKFVSDRKTQNSTSPTVLNLFGYTGAASVACALAGAKVVHVDAAKNMVQMCKQNATINKIDNIRYIVDDCSKFVEKEHRRGNKYDAIIMDPPSFGRGPNNEPWKLIDHICGFVKNTVKLLSDNPMFVLINSYTTGLQTAVLQNILTLNLPQGNIQSYELALPTQDRGLILPCGCSGMWFK